MIINVARTAGALVVLSGMRIRKRFSNTRKIQHPADAKSNTEPISTRGIFIL